MAKIKSQIYGTNSNDTNFSNHLIFEKVHFFYIAVENITHENTNKIMPKPALFIYACLSIRTISTRAERPLMKNFKVNSQKGLYMLSDNF